MHMYTHHSVGGWGSRAANWPGSYSVITVALAHVFWLNFPSCQNSWQIYRKMWPMTQLCLLIVTNKPLIATGLYCQWQCCLSPGAQMQCMQALCCNKCDAAPQNESRSECAWFRALHIFSCIITSTPREGFLPNNPDYTTSLENWSFFLSQMKVSVWDCCVKMWFFFILLLFWGPIKEEEEKEEEDCLVWIAPSASNLKSTAELPLRFKKKKKKNSQHGSRKTKLTTRQG